jgi:hypothetical protein
MTIAVTQPTTLRRRPLVRSPITWSLIRGGQASVIRFLIPRLLEAGRRIEPFGADSDDRDERWDGSFQERKDSVRRQGGPLRLQGHRHKGIGHGRCVQVLLVNKEVVRTFNEDPKLGQICPGEVADVRCHYHVGSAGQSCPTTCRSWSGTDSGTAGSRARI